MIWIVVKHTLLGSPLLVQGPGGDFENCKHEECGDQFCRPSEISMTSPPEHSQLPRLSPSNFRLSSHVFCHSVLSSTPYVSCSLSKAKFQENISVCCVRKIQPAAAISCPSSMQFVHACAMHLLLPDCKCYVVLALSVACEEFLLSTHFANWVAQNVARTQQTDWNPIRKVSNFQSARFLIPYYFKLY
jgi:hypothetical protein